MEHQKKKPQPGSCDLKSVLIWFLYPLSYPRNYQVGVAVSKVKFVGWTHMAQIKFDMVCLWCVCLFKEQAGWGSSEGSLKLATCVAAPCQPQLGAQLCLCEWPWGKTNFLLCCMHSSVHVCHVQGVAQFERITPRNAAGPILKKKKRVGGIEGKRPCVKSSLRPPIHENAIG